MSENTKYSEQHIANQSFNETLEINENLVYGYDGTNARAIKTDASGKLATDIASVVPTISTVNSSDTPLTSGSTFTGTGEDVSTFASIKVNSFSDVASATDGLQLQFSSDNTNWDISYDFTTVAGQGFVAEIGPEAKYFRIVYVNGGTNQADFRLQVIYHSISTQHLGVPVGTVVVDSDNAQLVKAVLAGKKPNGAYSDVNTTAGGNLKVALEELETGVDLASETTLAKLTDVLYATEYGATYNYIMKYKRGTTTWEIQRETISTGLREYATATSALATAWTDRATQTYGAA